VSRTQAILIEESKLDMPGVMVKEIVVRNYPYKEALSHVIGYLGEIGTLELEFLKGYGYAAKDLIGKDGIERLMDGVLRGRNGGMQIQIDNRGCQVKVLSSKIATKGKDIYLTIDSDLQNFIWKMMENKRGAIIFMNPNNGEILSMVSSPSYDPNDSVAKVLFDEGSPLLNRAIMCQYPPGSVFKIIIALLGLESERLQPLTTFFCRGRLRVGRDEFYCWKEDGHGLMNLEDAIIHSCNNYFQNTGLLLGADRICEYAMHFGFGKKTCIELFGEIEGFVPSRMWKKAEMKEPWYAGDTANLSIGQGYLLATPLQVACMIASVANGGENVEPHLLKGVNNIEIKGHKNVKLRIKKENLDVVRKAMEGVVEEPDGTGFRAWSELVSISAKTGTAQVGGGLRPHAWFGGFAPSENPEVCFVVFLEHGGSGGDIAALVAKKAVEYWYKNH
jgi:penicillin-binding protein 2